MVVRKRQAPPRPRCPGDPVELDPFEVSAIKAVAASMPLAWRAIEKICGVDRMSFAAGGEDGRRATEFFEGSRWVGLTLRQVRDLKMPTPKLPDIPDPHAVPKGPPPSET